MRASILVLTLACLALRCTAQDVSTGAIRGIVVDASNSRIAKASVVLLNEATGVRYERLSDSSGRFAFDLLPPRRLLCPRDGRTHVATDCSQRSRHPGCSDSA
jgi:carboxypeptidase family protein